MAPIHDTDLAEERWSKAEWEHYELWEKIEIRLRRRKWFWIAGTALTFLALSSVPIMMERRPKWGSLSAARRLGQEINRLKREASLAHEAYWIRFPDPSTMSFRIERSSGCVAEGRTLVREGELATAAEGIALLDEAQGSALSIPGLHREFCYDPLSPETSEPGAELRAFGLAPVKDLSEKRGDRVSILLLKGPAAEVSFE